MLRYITGSAPFDFLSKIPVVVVHRLCEYMSEGQTEPIKNLVNH
jgi:hypothetical protein